MRSSKTIYVPAFFSLCLLLMNVSVVTGNIVDSIGCGDTKGCLQDDTILVTWKLSDTTGYVDLELSATTDGWVALAFSSDTDMNDDSVTECVLNGTNIQVQQSFNGPYSNTILTDPQLGLVSVETSYADGRLECRVQRSITSASNNPQFFSLNTSYYLFAGFGPLVSPGIKSRHVIQPMISTQPIDITTDRNTVASAERSLSPMVKAHGCLMIAAWVLTASAGIVMARHYRVALAGKKACGQQLWLLVHRVSLMVAVCANIAGFVIIFVHVGGYSDTGAMTSSFMRAHPPMGIIVTGFVVINPIFMILRPKPGRRLYQPLTILHRSIGTLIQPVSAVTMFAGIVLRFGRVDVTRDPLFWLMVTTVAVQMTAEFLLFLHTECASKDNQVEDKASNKSDKEDDDTKTESHSKRSNKFRLTLLPIYLTLMAGLYVAMTVLIATYTIQA